MQNNRNHRKNSAGLVMNQAVSTTRALKSEPAYKRIQTAIRVRIDSGELKPGDVVDLLYEGAKAQFRIVWCGKRGTEMAGEVGVENLSTEVTLWDFDPKRCAAAVGQG